MQVIDLTHTIKNGMQTFGTKWHTDTEIKQLGQVKTVGRNTSTIQIGSHCGTHVDAPFHFIENGRKIDEIPLDELMGDVSIFDFSFLNKENDCLTLEMVKNLKLTDKIIFNFNWADKYNTPQFYKGYPYFSDEAADYLIANGVKLIGMDTPSPDDSRIKLLSSEDSKIHKKFLSANVILIEYLNNLNSIKDYNGWKIAALPLKLNSCDGASARIALFR